MEKERTGPQFLRLSKMFKRPTGAGVERTDGARLDASTKAARAAYFDNVNAKLDGRPIVFIGNWDETCVGSRVVAGNMASRILHGFVTGLHMVPQLPKAQYNDKTTLLQGIAVYLPDGINSTTVKAAPVCPSLFIFSGEDSVPTPADSTQLLPKSCYCATEKGAMTNDLFKLSGKGRERRKTAGIPK